MCHVEGMTTNGSALLPFKKGAFVSLKRVKPVFFDYKSASVSAAYDTIPFFANIVFMCCWFCMPVVVNEMPEFEPNEYLYRTHTKPGQERWEVFAWAVRDAMLKAGSFEACEMDHKQKYAYEAFMQKSRRQLTPFYERPLEDAIGIPETTQNQVVEVDDE